MKKSADPTCSSSSSANIVASARITVVLVSRSVSFVHSAASFSKIRTSQSTGSNICASENPYSLPPKITTRRRSCFADLPCRRPEKSRSFRGSPKIVATSPDSSTVSASGTKCLAFRETIARRTPAGALSARKVSPQASAVAPSRTCCISIRPRASSSITSESGLRTYLAISMAVSRSELNR